MNRKRMIRILVYIVLIPIFIYAAGIPNGMAYSPEAALRKSEAGLHYGPSDIKYTFTYGNKEYFLNTYKDWYAIEGFERAFGIYWRTATGLNTGERNLALPVNASWTYSSDDKLLIFGVINDENVSYLEIISDKERYRVTEFKNTMFYAFLKKSEALEEIQAYDHNGNLLVRLGRAGNEIVN